MSISKKQFKTELFIYKLFRNGPIIIRLKQKSNDCFVNKDAKLYFRNHITEKKKDPQTQRTAFADLESDNYKVK